MGAKVVSFDEYKAKKSGEPNEISQEERYLKMVARHTKRRAARNKAVLKAMAEESRRGK